VRVWVDFFGGLHFSHNPRYKGKNVTIRSEI